MYIYEQFPYIYEQSPYIYITSFKYIYIRYINIYVYIYVILNLLKKHLLIEDRDRLTKVDPDKRDTTVYKILLGLYV